MTTFLLDAGHGKDTAGKRSPEIPPGILEYEFNLNIVQRIIAKCGQMGIRTVNLKPEEEAITLKSRVERAKQFWMKDKNCIFISVHANAIGYGTWVENVTGVTTFCNPKSSQISKDLAWHLVDKISAHAQMRNRGARERGFYVLKKTPMPAVLTENGFMTNTCDATKLADPYWRDKIAEAHVLAMKDFNR
jgi:N-acetylmuramoyl-L-alanine amidase